MTIVPVPQPLLPSASIRVCTCHHPGIRSCDKEDGENRLYHLKPRSDCSTPEAAECTSAAVCRNADLDDPCDAPERCYGSTAPKCYSSRDGQNDSRYTLNVAGLPAHNEGPTYASWLTGGTTTGFVTELDNIVSGNQMSRSWSASATDWVTVTEPANLYATLNPASVSGVTARCNGAQVDFRAKFYCARPSPHTQICVALARASFHLGATAHVSLTHSRQLWHPTPSTSGVAQVSRKINGRIART